MTTDAWRRYHHSVDKLRRDYTEARDRAEANRDIALTVERELNKLGISVDARHSYIEQERILKAAKAK